MNVLKCLPNCLYYSSVLVEINFYIITWSNISLFVHLTQTLSSEQSSLRENVLWKRGHRGNRHPLKPVLLLMFVTQSCTLWFNRMNAQRALNMSMWAMPGCRGYTGSEWSVVGCILHRKSEWWLRWTGQR